MLINQPYHCMQFAVILILLHFVADNNKVHATAIIICLGMPMYLYYRDK